LGLSVVEAANLERGVVAKLVGIGFLFFLLVVVLTLLFIIVVIRL
jgi:hypothetical protein